MIFFLAISVCRLAYLLQKLYGVSFATDNTTQSELHPATKLGIKSTDFCRKAWKVFLEGDVCRVADSIQTMTAITFHTGSTRTICMPAILRAIKMMPVHGSRGGTFPTPPHETTFHSGFSLFENAIFCHVYGFRKTRRKCSTQHISIFVSIVYQYIVQYSILYIVEYSILYIVYCILYTVYCIVQYIVYCIVQYSILYTVQYSIAYCQYIVYQHIVYCIVQ